MKGFLFSLAKGGAAAAVKGAALSVGSGLVSVTSGVLAASMISYSSFVLYDTAYTQNQARSVSAELLSYRPTIIESEDVPLSGSTLSLINDDYRAWLTVDNTAIDYPVMQGVNDLYYAAHDIYKNASLTGAIYVASANSPDFSDSYNLIYGHHMDQSIMFGALDRYLDEGYLLSHRTGILATDMTIYDMTVFAVAETDAYEQAFYRAGDRMGEVTAFLQNPGPSTTVPYYDASALSGAGQIAALSTCASATTNGRLVVLYAMRPRATPPAPTPEDEQTISVSDEYDSTRGVSPGRVPTPEISAVSLPIDPEDEIPGLVPDGVPGSPGTPGPDGGPGGPGTPDQEGGGLPDSGLDESGSTRGGGLADTLLDLIELDDDETPLARFSSQFQPRGISYGGRAWVLVNLMALAMTAYLFLPLLHLRAKYFRAGIMRKVNRLKADLRTASDLDENQVLERRMINLDAAAEKACAEGREDIEEAVREAEAEEFASITQDDFAKAVERLYYHVKQFVRRFRIGALLELLIVAAAAYVFVHTEDIRLPMILIDKWTPLMLLLLALCWVADICLAQYRDKLPDPAKEEAITDRGMTDTAAA